MAASNGSASDKRTWENGDIVALVTLLVGIPAAAVAVFMVVVYLKKFRSSQRGKYCKKFLQVLIHT